MPQLSLCIAVHLKGESVLSGHTQIRLQRYTAVLLSDKGDCAAAEPLYRRALEGREQALGQRIHRR